jgi:hypothetical protein
VNLDTELGRRKVAESGNANELVLASSGPGKSSLFFLRRMSPGIGSARDRRIAVAKRHGSCGVRCAVAGP